MGPGVTEAKPAGMGLLLVFELEIRYVQKFSSLKAILQPAHGDHHNTGVTTARNIWKLHVCKMEWQ